MAELHEALSYLKPVTWEEVPASSASGELHKFAQEIFDKARLIVESVPEQNTSDIGKDAAASMTNLIPPGFSQTQLDKLRKEWGKPIKMNNAKENPLNIPIYKLTGKDGKGAWFARRSVHKGLPFSRWKSKMQTEMEETLKARQEEMKQGRTPETSIRGIGGDRILEKHEIRHPDRDETLGNLHVYELSAQFPGPTTPRDFVTLIITSDALLDEGTTDGPSLPPTYMIISKPCQHPEAPQRDAYIRGQYESVELIRELPTEKNTRGKVSRPTSGARSATTYGDHLGIGSSTAASQSNPSLNAKSPTSTGRPRGKTEPPVPVDLKGELENVVDDDPTPVEWIMITRSDPGGSVPRWMVERGTPKSITGDAVKFLNWASKPDELGEGDTADIGEVIESAEKDGRLHGAGNSDADSGRLSSKSGTAVSDQQPDAIQTDSKGVEQLDRSLTRTETSDSDEEQADSNLWSNVAKIVHNGLQDYAPKAVLNYIPGSLTPSSSGEIENRNITVPMKNAKTGQDEDEIYNAPGAYERKEQVDHATDADDTSSMASDDSFASADSHAPPSANAGLTPQIYVQDSPGTSSPRLASGVSSEAALVTAAAVAGDSPKSKPSHKEKDLAKLNARRREVEDKLATIQSEIRELGGVVDKGNKSTKSDVDSIRGSVMSAGSSSTEVQKEGGNAQVAVPDQKRVDQLSKTESKLISRLQKLEAQQLKVIRKLEADQRKAAERDEKTRSKSENDSLRKEITALKEEVHELREERTKWLDIVGRLQKENTKLVAQIQNRAETRDANPSGYGTD